MFYIDVNNNIKLKLLSFEDDKEFFELINRNRCHLEYFMPRINENKSIENTQKVISIFLKQLVDNNGFRAGIVFDGEIVGIIGLKYIDWVNRKTEIMYWIDKDHLGKGITTVCVNKIVDIAFTHYNLNKIIIKTSMANRASIRIAEKCEFSLEGICKEDELLADGYTNICLYSLLKDNYKSRG